MVYVCLRRDLSITICSAKPKSVLYASLLGIADPRQAQCGDEDEDKGSKPAGCGIAAGFPYLNWARNPLKRLDFKKINASKRQHFY